MRGRGISAAVLAALAISGCGEMRRAPDTDQKSVVLITVDTTRADHLGCYGNPLPITPEIDALAERGTVFENAYAPMPQTLPAHATLFTGLSPRLHGALESIFRLPDRADTLGVFG